MKQSCLCARCGRPVYVSGLSNPNSSKKLKGIVHHKIHLDTDNVFDDAIALNEDNLEGLCIDCHNNEHMARNNAVKDGYMFDNAGNLIPCKNNCAKEKEQENK